MSINSIANTAVQALSPASRSPLVGALSAGLDIASQLTQLTNSVLSNVLRAGQQFQQPFGNTGFGNPSMGTPGMGISGMGTPGLGSGLLNGANTLNNGLGAVSGLLQSFGSLLQSLTPLLQMLGGNRFGANNPAMQLGNQFPSFGGFPGNGIGVGPAVSGLGNAGGQLGSTIGSVIGGAPGAQIGGALGNAAGTVAGTVLQAAANNNVTSLMLGNGSTVPLGTPGATYGGVMTADAARQWALANGGTQQTADDVRHGMNLYSIFNTGLQRF